MAGAGKLSEHFTLSECSCRCGCGLCDIDLVLLSALENLRSRVARPIHTTSVQRCHSHNKAVGGTPHSQHLIGRAADIVVRDMTPDELAEQARQVPEFQNGGIGIYKSFLHVDVRGHTARW